MQLAVVVGAVVVGSLVVYAWFEAGWLRTRVVEVSIGGLPQALDGLRLAHLSDFHLGAPLSRGNLASERAAEWVRSRQPDLVCVTGDLVSHPRGERRLRRILGASRTRASSSATTTSRSRGIRSLVPLSCGSWNAPASCGTRQ